MISKALSAVPERTMEERAEELQKMVGGITDIVMQQEKAGYMY